MNRHLFTILIFFSSRLVAQDTTAYFLFNSVYSTDNYRLVDEAASYKLDSSRDSLFIQSCRQIVPKAILKSILGKESQSFMWNQIHLQNTTVISDSTTSKHDEEYLRLSAPIFDQTKSYAVAFEVYDAISCIHSGPVLLQYKDKKWIIVESWISSYHVKRGQTIPRER